MADGSAAGEADASEVVASGPVGSVPAPDVVGDETARAPSLSAGGIAPGEVHGRSTGRAGFAGFVVGAGLVGAASVIVVVAVAAAGRRFVAVAVPLAVAGLGGDEVDVAAKGEAGAARAAREAGGVLGVDDAFTTVGTAGVLSAAATAASRRAPHASTTKIAKSRAPATAAGRTCFA